MKEEIKITVKRSKKLFIAGMLSLMLVSLSGFTAHAAKKFTVGDFTYEESFDTVTLREYHGPAASHITIPGTVNGKAVWDVGNGIFGIFKNGKSIKRITVEEGVEEIQAMAFYGCENLEEVNLPASLRDIENMDTSAFSGCPSLRKITVAPESPYYYVKSGVLFDKRWNEMFYYPSGKRQKTYRVPEGIKLVFRFGYNPYLEKIILPRSVELVEAYCFFYVPNLKWLVASDGVKRVSGGRTTIQLERQS